MIKKILAIAAIAAAPLAAHAGLQTLTPADGWPPAGSTGLQPVLFNVNAANGVQVAIGAHAYKNDSYLSNDGVSNFYAQTGIYAPDGKGYANWSFDFAWNITGCSTCHVMLGVDDDKSANVHYLEADLTALGALHGDAWNLMMGFLSAANYDPFSASQTNFRLQVIDTAAANRVLASTEITVNVPEPASMALVGVALAGLGLARRRRQA